MVALDGAGHPAPPRLTPSARDRPLIAPPRIALGAGAVSEAEERGGDAIPAAQAWLLPRGRKAALRVTGSRARSLAVQVLAVLPPARGNVTRAVDGSMGALTDATIR